MNKAAAPSYELALRHYRSGDAAKAYQVCVLALRTMPDHVPTLSLIGKLDLKAGRLEPATQWLERAVQLAPTSRIDLCNLGVAYHRQKAFDRAAEVLARAVKLDPQRSDAVVNLGLVLLDRGDTERGLVCLARAAEIEPGSAALQRSLANELLKAERVDEAISRFRRAAELDPTSVELMLELLAALEQDNRFAKAVEVAQRIIKASPDLPAGYAGLGRALSKQLDFSNAVAAFQKAVALDPTNTRVANPLTFALAKLGRIDEALEYIAGVVAANPTLALEHSNLVFHAAFSPSYSAAQLLTVAQSWSEAHAKPLLGKRQPHLHDRSEGRRLRVAYVSADFWGHVQRLFTLPVLRQHDHSAYEIVCYSSVKAPDEWTEKLKACADEWYDVRDLSDSDLAQRIREDRIDVLVDLTMHMAGCRLKVFAEKPAPVQISWLAYPGTTGVDGVDYRITDPFLDPPQAPLPYSEHSLWLPHSFWCYDPASSEPLVGPLPAERAGHITFGCLNNFMKVNRVVLELWGRVLTTIPASKLLLLAPKGWSRNFVAEVLSGQGVGPERVEFVDQQARPEYLATYNRIDIALDTFPYNGHTTSLDAFWMGVPVITLVGDTIVGRAGLSLAHNLQLDELVAHNPDQFVETATLLSRDWARLNELRKGLRQRMEGSPLMDAPRFTRDLEGLYREAWRRGCLCDETVTVQGKPLLS